MSILMMNPQNGEILAMVNVPEFDLNDPFTLNYTVSSNQISQEEKQELLNRMWHSVRRAGRRCGKAYRHLLLSRLPGGGGPENSLSQKDWSRV